jgi:hypothetical protein
MEGLLIIGVLVALVWLSQKVKNLKPPTLKKKFEKHRGC